jgi:hypothetical protein
MSLIVDINPVPWKILDLVRARMLKNRAKKAKRSGDWSKEALKREMALPPAPLITRKRDEPSFVIGGQVAVGVGWVANNNTLGTPAYSNGLSCSQSTGVIIPNIYDGAGTSFAVVRTCSGTEVWTGACELRLHIGSGSAENWITDVFTFNWTSTLAYQNWREYQSVEPPLFYTQIDGTLNRSLNNEFDVWWFALPAGDDSIVLLSAIVRYTTQSNGVYGWGGLGTVQMTYAETSTYLVESIGTYLIKKESVIRLPAITQLPTLFDNLVKAYNDTRSGAWGHEQATIGQAWRGSGLAINAMGLPSNARASSSASFLYHKNPGTFNADAALGEFQNETGAGQIPIVGYRRDSVGYASPITERGVFGVIPGATVATQPVTPTLLEDELDQQPAANAVELGTDHQMLIAYDYHGGSYCRDQLSLLGINI